MSLFFLIIFSLNSLVNAANLVCYYPNWSTYRTDIWKFDTTNVNATLCTHYLYAFAILDQNALVITPSDEWADISLNGYANFVALKSQNPKAKFLISIGGASDSKTKYAKLVRVTVSINNFVTSVLAFLNLYKFDGLDIDWEWPTTAADMSGYSDLIIALKTAFKPYGYLLSAAISANPSVVDAGYNVPILNQNLDMVNLMTYDYHGASWEPTVANHHSPLHNSSTDTSIWNSEYSVNYLISKGMSPSKINMGVPLYGKSWILTSSVTSTPAPASGAGAVGPGTGQEGTLGYNEICSYVVKNGWSVKQDSTFAIGPYAVSPSSPKTWVGYDDPVMAKVKANYIMSKELGGGMVWDISMDDFRGNCNGGSNPVLSALSSILTASSTPTLAPTTMTSRTSKTTVGSLTSSKATTISHTSSKATSSKPINTSKSTPSTTIKSTSPKTSKPMTSKTSKPTTSTTSKPTTSTTSKATTSTTNKLTTPTTIKSISSTTSKPTTLSRSKPTTSTTSKRTTSTTPKRTTSTTSKRTTSTTSKPTV